MATALGRPSGSPKREPEMAILTRRTIELEGVPFFNIVDQPTKAAALDHHHSCSYCA